MTGIKYTAFYSAILSEAKNLWVGFNMNCLNT
jgi:hypothetical protein